MFPAGLALVVNVDGAEVPAFSTTATFPSPITPIAPIPDSTGSVYVDTTHDLRVTWTGGAALVALTIEYTGTSTGMLRCIFLGAAGEGIVPASTLGLLAGQTGTGIEVDSVADEEIGIGNWRLFVLLANRGWRTNVVLH